MTDVGEVKGEAEEVEDAAENLKLWLPCPGAEKDGNGREAWGAVEKLPSAANKKQSNVLVTAIPTELPNREIIMKTRWG